MRYNTWVGWSLLAIFLGSGVYLYMTIGADQEASRVAHMLYRANHIYLLMAALIHLLAGANMKRTSNRRRRKMYWANSVILSIGSVLLIVAFIHEPAQITLDRPLTFMGILFLFIGGVSTALYSR
jgi:hypothetical protein